MFELNFSFFFKSVLIRPTNVKVLGIETTALIVTWQVEPFVLDSIHRHTILVAPSTQKSSPNRDKSKWYFQISISWRDTKEEEIKQDASATKPKITLSLEIVIEDSHSRFPSTYPCEVTTLACFDDSLQWTLRPRPPLFPHVTEITPNYARVEWQSALFVSPSATDVEYHICEYNQHNGQVIAITRNTFVELDGLKGGLEYLVTVRGVTGINELTDESTPLLFQVPSFEKINTIETEWSPSIPENIRTYTIDSSKDKHICWRSPLLALGKIRYEKKIKGVENDWSVFSSSIPGQIRSATTAYSLQLRTACEWANHTYYSKPSDEIIIPPCASVNEDSRPLTTKPLSSKPLAPVQHRMLLQNVDVINVQEQFDPIVIILFASAKSSQTRYFLQSTEEIPFATICTSPTVQWCVHKIIRSRVTSLHIFKKTKHESNLVNSLPVKNNSSFIVELDLPNKDQYQCSLALFEYIYNNIDDKIPFSLALDVFKHSCFHPQIISEMAIKKLDDTNTRYSWDHIKSPIFAFCLFLRLQDNAFFPCGIEHIYRHIAQMKTPNVRSVEFSPLFLHTTDMYIHMSTFLQAQMVASQLKAIIGDLLPTIRDDLANRVSNEQRDHQKFLLLLWYNLLSLSERHSEKEHLPKMQQRLEMVSISDKVLPLVEIEIEYLSSFRVFPSEEMLLLIVLKTENVDLLLQRMSFIVFCMNTHMYIYNIFFGVNIQKLVMETNSSNCSSMAKIVENYSATFNKFGGTILFEKGVEVAQSLIRITFKQDAAPSQKTISLFLHFISCWISKAETQKDADRLNQLFQMLPPLNGSPSLLKQVTDMESLINSNLFIDYFVKLIKFFDEANEKTKQLFIKWIKVGISFIDIAKRIETYNLKWDVLQNLESQPKMKKEFGEKLDILSIKNRETVLSLITWKWTSQHFGGKFEYLDDRDRAKCIETVKTWMKTTQWDNICGVMDRLLEGFKSLQFQESDKWIVYFSSDEGQQLLNLLTELKNGVNTKRLKCLSILNDYQAWFVKLCSAMANKTIIVKTIDLLIKDDNFAILQRFHDKYKDAEQLKQLFLQFQQAKANRELLQCFFEGCLIDNKRFGEELEEMSRQDTELKNWSGWTLDKALKYDWKKMELHRQTLLDVDKIRYSDVALIMWKDLLKANDLKWSLRPLSELDTYQLWQWVRAHENELTWDIPSFDFETYVHRWAKHEITMVNTDEQALLKALYSQQTIATISKEDKEVTSRLWQLVEQRVENVLTGTYIPYINKYTHTYIFESSEQHQPNEKEFTMSKLAELLKTFKQRWESAKSTLRDQTITGDRINKSLEFAIKSVDAIYTQIRLMYQPDTRTIETLQLNEATLDHAMSLKIYKFHSTEARTDEIEKMDSLLKKLGLDMPKTNDKREGSALTSCNFISAFKREVIEYCEEKKTDEMYWTYIRWDNIMTTCHISLQFRSWVQFMAFYVLLTNGGTQEFNKYDTYAEALHNVFRCFDGKDSLQLLRDATNAMKLLLVNKEDKDESWKDKKWEEAKKWVSSFASKTMQDILEFWKIHNNGLPQLGSCETKWLGLITRYGKVFQECMTAFSNDKEFDRHLQTFAESDPIQHSRAMGLIQVRRFLVTFLSKGFRNLSEIQTYIHEVGVSITETQLESFRTVFGSWGSILRIVINPQEWIFQNDKALLYRISKVLLIFDSDQKNDAAGDQMSQAEFQQLLDRLLMFMTGDANGVDSDNLTQQSGITSMNEKELPILIQAYHKHFSKIGPNAAELVRKTLQRTQITGKMLVEYVKKDETKLVQILSGINPTSDVAHIITALKKIIEFETLREY
ncbi:hypothetical protein RFI_07840, partial [Reticulomyxa filosa]